MKKNIIDIIFRINETAFIGLANTRLNAGHDDSTPYQADIVAYEGRIGFGTPDKLRIIGTIWNDGWGGESEARRSDDREDTKKAIILIQALLRCNDFIYQGTDLGHLSIKTICDIMAEEFIYFPSGKTFEECEAKRKKMKGKTLRMKFLTKDSDSIVSEPGAPVAYSRD